MSVDIIGGLIKLGINVPNGKTSGQIKTKCPQCSHLRRNHNDPCLSVNLTDGLFDCHHCGYSGSVGSMNKYKLPAQNVEMTASSALLDFFKQRGITDETVGAFKVHVGERYFPQRDKAASCMVFPYMRGTMIVNNKYRDRNKNFVMEGGAEKILYNLNSVAGSDVAVLVEGEIDAMAVHQSKWKAVVSCPNGATLKNNNLDYISNSYKQIEHVKTWILFTDNDEAGIKLREDLAKRFGRDVCKLVKYPEGCKDANEILQKYGEQAVFDCIENAEQYPLESMVLVSDVVEDVVGIAEDGLAPGDLVPGFVQTNKFLTWVGSAIYLWTGVPSSGKSTMIDFVLGRLVVDKNRRVLYWSPERTPVKVHAAEIAEQISGHTIIGNNGFISSSRPKPSAEYIQKLMYFMSDKWYFIDTLAFDGTVENIMERAAQAVKIYGITDLVIDNYAYLEDFSAGSDDHKSTGIIYNKLRRFRDIYGVAIHLVAHPTKLPKDSSGNYIVATGYNVSGSAHHFNKVDVGLTVYRNEDDTTDLICWKYRWKWAGKAGFYSRFEFDPSNSVYTELFGFKRLSERNEKKDKEQPFTFSGEKPSSVPRP